jgi:tripartite-type tricarboxylate transporter receptor subunit TctC
MKVRSTLLTFSSLLLSAAAVHAQDAYPSRPIRIIVAIPAGSGSDTAARLIAEGLTRRVGKQVVVENRPGAGTILGNDAVAKSKPDGYTLLMNGAAFTIAPAFYKKLPYDAAHDFAPITNAVVAPNVMCVHPSVPVKSVKDLIALARARPDQILYASGGNGTNSHMATALFASMAGIRLVHVPYKGGAASSADLAAGQVQLVITNMPEQVAYVTSGRTRALGVSTAKRSPRFPDLPTISETLPGYESAQWTGVWAPAGTPPEVVSRLNREIVAVLALHDVRDKLMSDGSEIVASTPDAFAAMLKSEIARWQAAVKAAGIQQM